MLVNIDTIYDNRLQSKSTRSSALSRSSPFEFLCKAESLVMSVSSWPKLSWCDEHERLATRSKQEITAIDDFDHILLCSAKALLITVVLTN
jgi:hypothetical protein